MSYAGVCNVGVNLDTHAVVEPELFLNCLDLAFQDVIAAVPDRPRRPQE